MNNYPFRTTGQVPMGPVSSYPNQFQQPAQSTDMNWVQGNAGAKAFLVAPGHTAQLMDTEAPVFYIKTVDLSGMPLPLRTFDYTERIEKDDQVNYVTRSEFDELKKQFDDLLGGN